MSNQDETSKAPAKAGDWYATLTCTGDGVVPCTSPVTFRCAGCEKPYCEAHRAQFHGFNHTVRRHND
jgi:hypothetical protein